MVYDQVTDLLDFYLRLTHVTTENVAQFAFTEINLITGSPPPPQPHYLKSSGEHIDSYLVFEESGTANGLG